VQSIEIINRYETQDGFARKSSNIKWSCANLFLWQKTFSHFIFHRFTREHLIDQICETQK